MSDRVKNTCFVFLLNAVIAALFLNGQYFTETMGIKKLIFIGAIIVFLVICIPVLTYTWGFLNGLAGKTRLCIKEKLVWLWKNPLKVLLAIFLYGCAGGAAYGITLLVSNMNARNFMWPLFHMCFALLSVAVAVYLCRKQTAKKPEVLFAVLLITSGVYFINASPTELGVTWDDEAHFERTLTISNLASGVLYKADEEVFTKQQETALEHFGYSEEDRAQRTAYLNGLWDDKVTVQYVYKGMGNYATLSYIPFAFGITMGRGLHMPYNILFRFGKLVNLLTYTGVIYYAMKRLKFGKILLASIAMVPTMTYMAACYSYDPCVVGCMMLGFSVFFSYLQNPDSKMTNSDIALICFSFLLGCLPKAVYCVIMLPLLFMPSNRFVSKKQHAMYILCGCLTVGFLAATFVLPRILQGMGTGDTRGGSEVNATGQFEYIKEDPKRFLGVLWYFLSSTYLPPKNTVLYMENYAYLGVNLHNYVTPAMILLAAFTDRTGEKGKTWIVSIASIIGAALGVLIVAFTFYLVYTPVGYHTILGCQWRYLFPMVFPFLYAIGIDRFRNPLKRKYYNAIPMLWMTLSFIIYTGIQLVQLY